MDINNEHEKTLNKNKNDENTPTKAPPITTKDSSVEYDHFMRISMEEHEII